MKRKPKTVNPFYVSKQWRRVRQMVLTRDQYTCIECGTNVRGKRKAYVDHIQTLKDHPALALDMRNLRTMCGPCHEKRHILERTGQPDTPKADANGFPPNSGWTE